MSGHIPTYIAELAIENLRQDVADLRRENEQLKKQIEVYKSLLGEERK